MREYIYAGRTQGGARNHAADARADVDKLVNIFKKTIGDTWAKAVKPNTTSQVTEGPQRLRRPWIEVAEVMKRKGNAAPAAFVRSHVSALTPFFTWDA